MSKSGSARQRRRWLIVSAAVAALALTIAACGRSSAPAAGTPASKTAQPSASSAPANVAGSFGDLGRVCGPGTAKGATARGVTDTEIHVATSSDPANSVLPGLGQEFFDVATAFTKWCNAAGGINGRKIVLDQFDSKLFEVAAAVINACRDDFMLVGNGNSIDAPAVKPRLACKLGQIPAEAVSTQAATAGLQVTPTPNLPTEYQVGPLRLLADAYPAAKQGLGIGSINVASIAPQGKKAAQAYEGLGYRVAVVQAKPAAVDNFRPYMEQLKGAKANGYYEIVQSDPLPIITAANDVGYKPSFVLFAPQFYDPKSVAAAKSIEFPPTYVGLNHLPFELADQYPVLKEVKSILSASISSPKLTSFTMTGFNAWLLWAKSAEQCGSNLTQDCVLQKAGSYSSWTAGGLFPPVSTMPGKQHSSDCTLLMRLTPNGFVYDKKVTAPNDGPYNCDPKNVATVDSFES
jgi:ABC-type branched-subunit amino acid transport system substrate-binding protein